CLTCLFTAAQGFKCVFFLFLQISPRYFGNRTQWDYRGASNLEDLHQRLSSIMIRRLKNEVLTQLPPKIRQRIPFDLPKDIAKEMNTSFEEWEKLMRCPESIFRLHQSVHPSHGAHHTHV
ncbi:unnamed protein product, partial [Staurois parvus]